ncbi:MAG: hypothetical protein CHACPFDD_01474 [Phycisphaerae bacterium]|nr:hypothetical protein [Phycisphaerae bacterium]
MTTPRNLTLLIAVSALAASGGCIPLFDFTSREQPLGAQLATSVTSPEADRTILAGTAISVRWGLVNRTGQDATVIIEVERRDDRSRTEIFQQTTSETLVAKTTSWDTTDFPSGDYAVVVRAVVGELTAEAGSPGRIIINAPASFRFTAPASDATLPLNGTVTIGWTAFDGDGDGRVSIGVDTDANHSSGNEHTILADRVLPRFSTADTFDWDGRDTDGELLPAATYNVFATVTDTLHDAAVVEALATITTPNTQPTFAFTGLSSDVTVDSGDSVTITWTVSDVDDTAFVTILIDDDTADDDANDTTPATVIVARQNDADGDGETTWDTSGFAAGEYFVQARVEDDVNTALFVVAGGSVTVQNAAPEVTFTAPTEDTTFLTTDTPLSIAFTVTDADDDALIDLKIDADDDHANGNEQTILQQRQILAGTSDETFAWNGNLANGTPAADGIYVLFATANDNVNAPATVVADALIFRRSGANQPLIALLSPASPQTIDPGDFLTIGWRDDDPAGDATIRITVDDDATPGEGTETGDAEVEILSGRSAASDDGLDTFLWQAPSLDPGTYHVFGYISGTGGQHVVVSQGTVIIRDPSQ